MEPEKIVRTCVRTFAQYHQLAESQVQVLEYFERSICLQPPPGPGHVSTGSLTPCIMSLVNTPLGKFYLYMGKRGMGNVFWKKA